MIHMVQRSLLPFLSGEDITDIEWPAQSPDMNPIENTWKECAKEKNPRNIEELWTNLKG